MPGHHQAAGCGLRKCRELRINTLPLAQLTFQTQFGTNYNLAFASYLLALLPMLVFYLFAQKQIINGVVSGAVK